MPAFSVLDLAPVPEGRTVADALRNTAELAQLKATGQPLPEDLVRLEALLDQEFRSRVAKK